MKILTILPLTENYSKRYAGAVSLFVKDNNKFSSHKNFIVGSTNKKDYISKNYLNINVTRSFFNFSRNINYSKKILNLINHKKFDLVEVHNRPQIAHYLIKNSLKNVILFFHNDPLTLRNSKTTNERLHLLNKCRIIFFNSKWTRNQFFKGINFKSKNSTRIIYQGTNIKNKMYNKSKIITFAGKLNKSKGYDVFCDSVIEILNKYTEWKAYAIGSEPREKYYFNHKNLIHTGWLKYQSVINIFKKSSIVVVNSNWEEPFGRVSVEAAATGNAVILTKRGGLLETTKYRVLLKKNNKEYLVKALKKLITNSIYLKNLQNKTRKYFAHDSKRIIRELDIIRQNLI